MNDKKINRNTIRKERTKNAILNATKELFYEQGYVKTTINSIMEKADLGHGTFYQYFKSKRDILNYLINELSDSLDKYLIPEQRLPNVKDWLYYGVFGYLKFYNDKKEMITVIRDAVSVDDRYQAEWNKIHNRLVERVTTDINNSLKRGVCREQINTTVTVFSVVSMMEGMAEKYIANELGDINLETVAEGIVDMVYHAIFMK